MIFAVLSLNGTCTVISVSYTHLKPEAKRFRKWVTSEVLPSIRKHGAYMTQQTIEKALADVYKRQDMDGGRNDAEKSADRPLLGQLPDEDMRRHKVAVYAV